MCSQLESSKQKLLQQTTQLTELTMLIARKDLEIQRANESAERAVKDVQVAQERTRSACLQVLTPPHRDSKARDTSSRGEGEC